MPLFDTHAHFDTFDADGTVGAVLSRAVDAGVARLCAVGSSAASNDLCVRLAEARPDLLHSIPLFFSDHFLVSFWYQFIY